MKDNNFIKENNAKHMWHPMGHPADSLAHPPTVITSAKDSSITDIDGNTVVDAVGGLWCVNLGYSNDVVKEAITRYRSLPQADAGICVEDGRINPVF